jgi:hypothetical protein
MVSWVAQAGHCISSSPWPKRVPVDEVLHPQLKLLEAGDPEPVLPAALLFKAQLAVDALVSLEQPVQTRLHTCLLFVQTEV